MIDHKELLETLAYDPCTGEFTWLKPRQNIQVGARAKLAIENHGEFLCGVAL